MSGMLQSQQERQFRLYSTSSGTMVLTGGSSLLWSDTKIEVQGCVCVVCKIKAI